MKAILTLLLTTTLLFSYDIDPNALEEGHVNALTGELIISTEGGYKSINRARGPYLFTHLTFFEDTCMAKVAEPSGLMLSYTPKEAHFYELNLPEGVINTSFGVISAETNLNNQSLRRVDRFTFLLTTPKGTLRFYKKSYYKPNEMHFLLKKELFSDGAYKEYEYDQNHKLYKINRQKVNPDKSDLHRLDEEIVFESDKVIKFRDKTFEYIPNQTTVTEGGGSKTVYTADKGRLIKKEDFDPEGILFQSVEYTWDDMGNLLTCREGAKILSYEYDQRFNPTCKEIDSIALKKKYDDSDALTLLINKAKEKENQTSYTLDDTKALEGDVTIDREDDNSKPIIKIEDEPEFPTDVLGKKVTYPSQDKAILEEVFDKEGQPYLSRNNSESQIDNSLEKIAPTPLKLEDRYEIERDHQRRTTSKRLYDKKGNLYSEETWNYSDSQLLSHTDVRGLSTEFDYNDLGQKIQETLKTSLGNLETYFTYDEKGRLSSSEKGEIVTLYKYGDEGELIETREQDLEGHLLTLNAPIHKPGSLTMPFDKNAEGIHIEKDILGNITHVFTDDGTVNYSIEYNLKHQPTKLIDHILGLEGNRSYDDLGNLISETLLNGQTLKSTYDLYGRRIELTLPDSSVIYSKWGPKFLQEMKRITCKGKYHYTHRFMKYNLRGFPIKQRLHSGFGQVSYLLNDENKFTEIHTRFFDLLRQPVGLELAEPIEAPFTLKRDGLGRVIEIIQDERTIHFTYDVFGRRMSKKVIEDVQDSRYDPIDLAYLYDNERDIGAIDLNTDKLSELRILADYPINPGDQATSYELGGLPYVPLYDLDGNIHQLISLIRGKLMESYSYSPSGRVTISDIWGDILPRSKALNPWRFRCHRFDKETDLYYIGGHYYDLSLNLITNNSLN